MNSTVTDTTRVYFFANYQLQGNALAFDLDAKDGTRGKRILDDSQEAGEYSMLLT